MLLLGIQAMRSGCREVNSLRVSCRNGESLQEGSPPESFGAQANGAFSSFESKTSDEHESGKQRASQL